MLIIRGVNVFPSQIEQVITGFPEIATQYQIILTTQGPARPRASCRWRRFPTSPFDEIRKLEDLKAPPGRRAQEQPAGIAVEIKIVEPKTIERSEGKAKRIIDLREGK